METDKVEYKGSPEYNPYLLITGVLAMVGGLLISSFIALLWKKELMNDEYWPEVVRDESLCPRCKADTHADRISRNWLVKILFGWLPIKRYVCYKCKGKYHTIEK